MARRCASASPIGIARLDDHTLRFTYDSPSWEGGVATVEPAAGEAVWGVLWSLDADDVAALDMYEGVPTVYRRVEATVVAEAGPVRAMLYVANAFTDTPPSARYLEGILRGARAFGLPASYCDRLAAVPTA